MKQKLKDIKAVLDGLTEEQLEQSAFLMGVDEPGFNIIIEVMSEPFLQTDEGLSPPWPEMTEEEKEEFPEIYPAGSVFFFKGYEVNPIVAFEVKEVDGGFIVYDMDSGKPITDVCPKDVANEICSDFNAMKNGRFDVLDKYEE